MKRVLIAVGACIVLVPLLGLGSAFFLAQRADYGWSPGISTPRFTAEHPRVLIDEGHYNSSTAGFAGRYWPFARLLRADGYALARGHEALRPRPAGPAQGLALAYVKGRVVVLGEGAMVTAQVDRQFVPNVMHWLSGTL